MYTLALRCTFPLPPIWWITLLRVLQKGSCLIWPDTPENNHALKVVQRAVPRIRQTVSMWLLGVVERLPGVNTLLKVFSDNNNNDNRNNYSNNSNNNNITTTSGANQTSGPMPPSGIIGNRKTPPNPRLKWWTTATPTTTVDA